VERALITGGCGFVGRHFTQDLVRRGYDVTVVDDLSAGPAPADWPAFVRPPRDFRFLRADARDFFKETTQSFDLILHLSAVVGGRLTIEGDPLKVATDLAIDAMFFNWLPKLKPAPKKVIYFSSSAAYPTRFQTSQSPKLLSEEMIDFNEDIGQPDMTYGWSKLTGEFLAKFSAEQYGLNVVMYRPFSGYGEDQHLSYPFPSIVTRVVNKESPITIWGSGNQTRDFIHIDDCVEGVMVTMNQMAPGECLNLGWGRSTSFYELAKICMKTAGHDAEIIADTTKPEGVFARVADCTRFFRLYKPRITLEEGVERAVRYLSK